MPSVAAPASPKPQLSIKATFSNDRVSHMLEDDADVFTQERRLSSSVHELRREPPVLTRPQRANSTSSHVRPTENLSQRQENKLPTQESELQIQETTKSHTRETITLQTQENELQIQETTRLQTQENTRSQTQEATASQTHVRDSWELLTNRSLHPTHHKVNSWKASTVTTDSPVLSPSTSKGFESESAQDEASDDYSSRVSSHSASTVQNLRHEAPRVVEEVERKIRQMLPLVVTDCHGGRVWYTGPHWQGARIAKWGGDRNAVSKVFLARNSWKAQHGRISLMVSLGNDEKVMEFIAVKDCGAEQCELLLGPDKDAFRIFDGVPLPVGRPSTPDSPVVSHSQALDVVDDSPTPRQAIRTQDPFSRPKSFGCQPMDTETKIVIKQSSTPQSIPSESTLRDKHPPNEDPSAKESTGGTQRTLMLAVGCFVVILMVLAPVFALCVLKLPEVIRSLSQFDTPIRYDEKHPTSDVSGQHSYNLKCLQMRKRGVTYGQAGL